jgi:hypothetical protein
MTAPTEIKSIEQQVAEHLRLLTSDRQQEVLNFVKSLLTDRRIEHPVEGWQPGMSALDISRDLVGCVEGPGDLSTNPKYMEGFGTK